MLSEKNILNETKNHNPPFKLNGRSLKGIIDDIINTAVKTAEVDEQKNKIFTTFY